LVNASPELFLPALLDCERYSLKGWNCAMQVLDIGCGKNKRLGAIGMDRIALTGVDVVHDLDVFPYPFADNTFDEIYATHVIEHVDSIVRAMEEIHRLAKPNGKVVVVTPHYSDFQSWNDPTHKWHLTTYSFRYFREDYESSYYSKARFKTEKIHIDMARLWRALGFQHLINFSLQHEALRSITKFWEGYLSLVVRAGAMTFVLRAIKECVGRDSAARAPNPTRHLNAETSRPRD